MITASLIVASSAAVVTVIAIFQGGNAPSPRGF